MSAFTIAGKAQDAVIKGHDGLALRVMSPPPPPLATLCEYHCYLKAAYPQQ